jgi:hypothetical protein
MLTIDNRPVVLTRGVGSYEPAEDGAIRACVMAVEVAQYRLSRGEPLGKATDTLDCACPVLRAGLIHADMAGWWDDDADRTAVLGRWIGRIAGTRADDAETLRRMFALVDAAVRIDAANAMDAAGLTAEAEELRALPEIKNKAAASATASASAWEARAASAAAAASAWAAHAAVAWAAHAEASAAQPAVAWAVHAAASTARATARAATWAAEATAARKSIRDRFMDRLATVCGVNLENE